MCGRFTLRTPSRDLVEIFQPLRSPDIAPRYNIEPTQPVLAIPQVGKFHEPSLLRWGGQKSQRESRFNFRSNSFSRSDCSGTPSYR